MFGLVFKPFSIISHSSQWHFSCCHFNHGHLGRWKKKKQGDCKKNISTHIESYFDLENTLQLKCLFLITLQLWSALMIYYGWSVQFRVMMTGLVANGASYVNPCLCFIQPRVLFRITGCKNNSLSSFHLVLQMRRLLPHEWGILS